MADEAELAHIQFVPQGTYEKRRQEKLQRREINHVDGSRVSELYRNIIASPSAVVQKKPRKVAKETTRTSSSTTAHVASSFYCEVCQVHVENLPEQEHQHLTPHQIELGKQLSSAGAGEKIQAPVQYHLGRENVGFKMLKAGGWETHEGLGKEGQGRKEPVPTVLKNDKLGLGIKKAKKEELEARRVTHSSQQVEKMAAEAKAAKAATRMTPSQRKLNEIKERKWRQEALRYLND